MTSTGGVGSRGSVRRSCAVLAESGARHQNASRLSPGIDDHHQSAPALRFNIVVRGVWPM